MALASLAAGCGPTWPKVRAVYHPEFLGNPARVQSVDVLPADIAVAVDEDMKLDTFRVAETINNTALREVVYEVHKRGYDVRQLDWRGNYRNQGTAHQAMSADDLVSTTAALQRYGDNQLEGIAAGKPRTLKTRLPVKLGEATGSDATLYVGGRAFVGTPPSHGDGAAIAIVAIFAILAVGAVALAASDDGGSSSSSGRKKRSKSKSKSKSGTKRARGTSGRSRRGGASTVGSVFRPTRDHRARRSGAPSSSRGGRGGRVARVARGTRDHRSRSTATSPSGSTSRGSTGRPAGRNTGRRVATYEPAIDVRVNVDLAPADTARPATRERRPIEAEKFAWIELELVLVSNETGHVQWHARQRFDIAPQNAAHLRQAVRTMLDTLPRRPRGNRVASQ